MRLVGAGEEEEKPPRFKEEEKLRAAWELPGRWPWRGRVV